jgi:hypothetical protein
MMPPPGGQWPQQPPPPAGQWHPQFPPPPPMPPAGQWDQQYPLPPHGGYYQYVPPTFAPTPSNGMGTAGFVCGLLGVLLFWIPLLGAVLAIVGLVLGTYGYLNGGRMRLPTGLALAGAILGGVGLLLFMVMLVATGS